MLKSLSGALQPLDTLHRNNVLGEFPLKIMVSRVGLMSVGFAHELPQALQLPYRKERLYLIAPIRLCFSHLHETERNTLDTSRHKL